MRIRTIRTVKERGAFLQFRALCGRAPLGKVTQAGGQAGHAEQGTRAGLLRATARRPT